MLSRRTTLISLALAGIIPAAFSATRSFAQDGTEAKSDSGAADYVTQTLTVGTLALDSSKVAAEKATDPMVKEFANLEIGEQTAIAQVLSSTEAGKTPPALSQEDTGKLDELKGKEGADFDKAYVQMQLDGHKKLLDIQKSMSAGNQPTVEVITAKLAEQAVTSHIAALNHINEMLNS